ncbi:CHAT domain-containing protein, partial [bacterium]|nr:CHAT domain-containing protein [bacterium]
PGPNPPGGGLRRPPHLDSPWPRVAQGGLLAGVPHGPWIALGRPLRRVLAEGLFPAEPPIPVLRAETAMIGWLDVDLGDGPRAWAWSLRDDAVHWHELTGVAGHVDAVRSLREALAAPGPLGRLRRLAHDVWRLRIASLEGDLEGVSHVVVVPSGDMLGVPVSALVDDRDGWLGDRWTLSYAPSPAVYGWLHEQEDRGDGPGLFVGDPDLGERATVLADSRRPSDAVIRGASHGLRASLDELPPLPGTRLEVRELAGTWPGSILRLGAEASEASLASLAEDDGLHRFRVLHFATHALVDADDADASALVLCQTGLPDPMDVLATGGRVFDGLVTSGEIVDDWRLDADLVVLSACNSALGRSVAGEGLVGFAHAFLRAGARATLASQWSVPDRATLLFMSAFYAAWREGSTSRAEALDAACHALRSHRDEQGRLPYGHPYYWAPFVLVGDDR